MKTGFKFVILLFLLSFLLTALGALEFSYGIIPFAIVNKIPQFVTIFISIVIQALPFVLIGVFGSALIQRYITVEMIENRLTRTKRLPGILMAIGAGFFFPVCDCGVIPVVKRLLLKRVPPYMAIAFLITAPLVNPITIWATATAFGYNIGITLIRVGMAVLVGIIVSLFIGKYFSRVEDIFKPHLLSDLEAASGEHSAHCHCHACESEPEHSTSQKSLNGIFEHAIDEFLEVGKFLVFGSLIAATMQTFIPRETVMVFTKNPVLSVGIMMLTALILSLCAEADAFVARSFAFHFPLGSVMAFMVFGQMFDIKNTALLLKSFKPKLVFAMIFLCAILVFLMCSVFNLMVTDGWIWGRF